MAFETKTNRKKVNRNKNGSLGEIIGDAASELTPYLLIGIGYFYFTKKGEKTRQGLKDKAYGDKMQNELNQWGFSPRASALVFKWELHDSVFGVWFNATESNLYAEAEKIAKTADPEKTWLLVRNHYFGLTGRELEIDMKKIDWDDYSFNEGESKKFYEKAGLKPR